MALTTAAGHAAADGVDPSKATPAQRDQAQARFLKGRDLFAQGRFDAALEQFRGSHDVVASPNARLYAARCLREQKRLAAAYTELGRTAAEARAQSRDDPRYARTAEAADEERRALAPKLGMLTVTVVNPEATTTLKVDGDELQRDEWADAIPAAPGSSEVTVQTPGRVPLKQSVAVQAGEAKALRFDAATAGPVTAGGEPHAAASIAPAAEPPSADAGRARMRTASYVAGGVGLAGLVTFGVAGALSAGKFSDLKTACGGPCPPSRQGDIDAGRQEQTIANVGLVIGLLGVATGVTLFLMSAPKTSPPPSAGLVFAPNGIGGVF